jgi:hypothetical protein
MRRRAPRAGALIAAGIVGALGAMGAAARPARAQAQPAEEPAAGPPDALARYYAALDALRLVDVESASVATLRRDLGQAEDLLKAGTFANAAVALYAIVRSPRYAAFRDFVEYQNAEYDLGVALARAGSYGAALDALEAVLRRGPAATYWGPAHRRAIDVALETRDHAGVLARLEAIPARDAIPPSAAGERAYLRGRVAYDRGKLADAEAELTTVSKRSRLYSSAVYLRGVIRARRGEYRGSAEAMCEIAATADDDKLTFVVDERYFTIKDLARLGLGRIAHEQGEYDDAYYHYFQIPEDSTYLPDALFEASWSMYQKRELATARDLVRELLREFPSSPLWPEASLLAGYVELADCKFTDSQRWYDQLVARLQPIVDTIDQIRRDRQLRDQLFGTAIQRFRQAKQLEPGAPAAVAVAPRTALDEALALLRLDPRFVRLSDAVVGTRELAREAGTTARAWQALSTQLGAEGVAAQSARPTAADEQRADTGALVDDLRRLGEQLAEARAEVARGRREGRAPRADADAELARLDQLVARQRAALAAATMAADRAASAAGGRAPTSIRPLLEADLGEARRLDRAAHDLADKLEQAGDRLAQGAIERLHLEARRVLDKAKLGKIDAVIGQKRKLDIEVQDLAAGRFPEELVGRMWNASMIGDDEELWPWQGEYWADEYEGWR